MVAAFSVFGFMIDGAALDLHLADGQVALKIGHIVIGVPQTPFHKREYRKILGLVAGVLQRQPGDLSRITQRHQRRLGGFQPVFAAGDPGIAQPMAAFVMVQRGFDRHPARGPQYAAVVDIKIFAARVGGNIVIAVTGQPQHPRVFIKAVAAAGVGHQRKKVLLAQIIDPGVGGVRPGNHIFPRLIVEIAVFHMYKSFPAGENRLIAA